METTTFIELHNSQDFTNITPQQALVIVQDHLDTYQEGERFLRRYQSTRDTLEAIYGKKINKRKETSSTKVKTSQNGSETTTPSKAKKYRYVMTDIEKEISHLSFIAKAIYNNILITHDSNALGIFQYDLGTKAGYLGIPVETLIKGLQELQETGYAIYKDGYIFHNHFIQQQKSSGNNDNKRGAIKIYNALPANIKLPYINSLDLTTATAKQVNELYERLSIAIPVMGDLLSTIPLTNDFKNDLKEAFGEDSENLINNGYTSLMDTLQVEDFRKNITKTEIEIPVIYNDEELKEVKQEVIQPVTQQPQQEVKGETTPIIETIQPVITQVEQEEEIKQPQQDEFKVITPVIQQQEDIQPTLSAEDKFDKILETISTGNYEKPLPVEKMTDEEIEDFILSKIDDMPNEYKPKAKLLLKKDEFNNVYLYVKNGGRNSVEIKKYYDEAIRLCFQKSA
ncbi:hypothetical protein [Empedobacter sp. 189-2]|uniref:hypothetical protein n=1 Tax=Empedobacter sp. 189-2 TaxID=2746724 RepID=UPI002577A458|nr:hypothetical protein [Empedobacter sp. 189-2]MDM1542345.1 hypothetical protein [Empedobacter sp. 189-2]